MYVFKKFSFGKSQRIVVRQFPCWVIFFHGFTNLRTVGRSKFPPGRHEICIIRNKYIYNARVRLSDNFSQVSVSVSLLKPGTSFSVYLYIFTNIDQVIVAMSLDQGQDQINKISKFTHNFTACLYSTKACSMAKIISRSMELMWVSYELQATKEYTPIYFKCVCDLCVTWMVLFWLKSILLQLIFWSSDVVNFIPLTLLSFQVS